MFLECDPAKPKVFGIGLSRTGTTSLHAALQRLGYRSAHWKNPFTNRILGPADFYYFDAITDINTIVFLESLYFAFPRSVFVYTTRNIETWTASVSSHYDAATPKLLQRYLKDIPATDEFRTSPPYVLGVDVQFMHHAIYANHETWADAYRAHDRRVRSFFAAHDQSRLLQFDLLSDTDPWSSLCGFLDKPKPAQPFPHSSWKRPEHAPALWQVGPFARPPKPSQRP